MIQQVRTCSFCTVPAAALQKAMGLLEFLFRLRQDSHQDLPRLMKIPSTKKTRKKRVSQASSAVSASALTPRLSDLGGGCKLRWNWLDKRPQAGASSASAPKSAGWTAMPEPQTSQWARRCMRGKAGQGWRLFPAGAASRLMAASVLESEAFDVATWFTPGTTACEHK